MITRTYKALTSRPVFVLAAALAILMLAAPFVFAATSVTYPENGMDPVATFSATDQDGDAIVWGLDGDDKGAFMIDGWRALLQELAQLRGAGQDDRKDNVYKVKVTASGGSEDVIVTVTDVDEPGKPTVDQASASGWAGPRGRRAGGPGRAHHRREVAVGQVHGHDDLGGHRESHAVGFQEPRGGGR